MDKRLNMIYENANVISRQESKSLIGAYDSVKVADNKKLYSLFAEKVHGEKLQFEEQIIWRIAEKEMILKYFPDILKRFHNIEVEYIPCELIVRSKEYPYLVADLNTGFVQQAKKGIMPVVLTNTDYMNYDWFEKDTFFDAPDKIILTAQHLMVVTGLKEVIVLAYSNKMITVRYIQYDKLLADDLIKSCKNFYDKHVITKTPPKVETEEDIKFASFYYKKYLSSPIIELSDDQIKLLSKRAELMEKLKEPNAVEKEKEAINLQLKIFMADKEVAHGGGYKVTYKGTIPEGCDDPQKITRRLYVGKDK